MAWQIVVGVAVTAFTIVYMYVENDANREPVDAIVPKEKQTYELPGDERIRRMNRKDWVGDKLVSVPVSGCKTLYENFSDAVENNSDRDCLGHYDQSTKGYVWQTYKAVAERVQNLGSGLLFMGSEPRKTKIGIMAKNIPEWVISEQACNAFSLILVPLYDTLGPEAMSFIVSQVKISTVIGDQVAIPDLLKHAKDIGIDTIIKVGAPTEDEIAKAKASNVKLFDIIEIENMGKENPHNQVPPKPEDLATIQYTSGTTGNPKGVMLSHANMIADMAGAMKIVDAVVKFDNNDIHISYLPLAHSFERLIQSIVWNGGARVGFYRGDTRLILDDIKLLKPSLFISVPRLLNRVSDKIQEKVSNGGILTRFIFALATSQKRKMLEKGIVANDTIWDRIAFRKVQEALGGNVRGIVSGAAPLSPAVMDFLRCTMGCHVVEGYGQTECSAASTVTIPGDHDLGHVGPPLPCNEIKLIDVPEMKYFAKEGKGEVCMRGANVFVGYFNDEEKTKETINDEGWLLTGDIGMWLPNGSLKIIDRRKNIFKLSQGEYIAPEKVEEVYTRAAGVSQVYLHGTSMESCCVAIVVPEKEDILQVLKAEGIDTSGDYEALIKSKQVYEYLKKTLFVLGKDAGLKGFEQARDIHVSTDVFTVENGLLTPTFKSKRPQLREYFGNEIESMYAKLR
eukprot:CFRG2230T1